MWRIGFPFRLSRVGSTISAIRRNMFVQVQDTPNPNSLKFLPGSKMIDSTKTINYTGIREAKNSPLAKRIFQIEGVSGVFISQEFVTVTKGEDSEWKVLKPQVFATIMDHFNSGTPAVIESEDTEENPEAVQYDDPIIDMIVELLDTRIRPTVQEDGGDVEFEEWDENTGVVKLRLQGACTGCPSSMVTLKGGIEQMLKFYIPEVKSVEQIDPEADRPKVVGADGVERPHPVDDEFDKLEKAIRTRQQNRERQHQSNE